MSASYTPRRSFHLHLQPSVLIEKQPMTPFRPPHNLIHHATTHRIAFISLSLLSIPTLYATRKASMSTNAPTSTPSTNNQKPTTFPTRPYTPRLNRPPYTPQDFLRQDETDDKDFYAQPRFVTHIDDHAIERLKVYYETVLPRSGRVLDMCSSWVSHFPGGLEERAKEMVGMKKEEEGERDVGKVKGEGEGKGEEGGKKEEGLEVIGLGMNAAELSANPILSSTILQNLNTKPNLPPHLAPLSTTVCVVSIDYLTQPIAVLSSLLQHTKPGGSVHLVISNRCFPTKAIGRWLRVGEEERLQMVGDFLWEGGWRGLEVVELEDGRGSGAGERVMGRGWFGGLGGLGGMGGRVDPLWVVRGVKEGVRDGG